MATPDLTLAFIPGTGRMGKLLAEHYGKLGYNILIGSRSEDKALQAAEAIAEKYGIYAMGLDNKTAAQGGDIIFWCIQGSLEERRRHLQGMRAELRGKIVIDVTNIAYLLPLEQWGTTSSTLRNQEDLGVPARWTTAFKNTFWKLLEHPPPASDPHSVFVCGDDDEAVAKTIELVDAIQGFKGVRAGDLKYSRIVELMGPPWIVELDKLNNEGKMTMGWKLAK